jgi:hypothetical protein
MQKQKGPPPTWPLASRKHYRMMLDSVKLAFLRIRFALKKASISQSN